MNREQWHQLPLEVEWLWKWLANKDPTARCRYDGTFVQQSLSIPSLREFLGYLKQLEEYNQRVEPNGIIVKLGRCADAYYVDITDAARWMWRQYQQEKEQRICPDCGKADRREVVAMWCPNCRRLFNIEETTERSQ